MRKFHCLLFVLKRSYICYYIIWMTVPLNFKKNVYVFVVFLYLVKTLSQRYVSDVVAPRKKNHFFTTC